MNGNTRTYSLDQLREVAEWLIQKAKNQTIWAFYGKMGAGKTTLIKEICSKLKVTDNVTSPTFALINEYHTSDNKIVYHFDFYRINKIEEAYDLGTDEYFESKNLCLIEWPELAEELLPKEHLRVKIQTPDNQNTREISLEFIN